LGSQSPRLPKRTRSQRLLETIGDAKEVVVMTHDNPDPDAIASGWGVCVLLERRLSVSTRFLAGGAITRAENRAMVDTLRPPLRMVERQLPPRQAPLVLVDTRSPSRLAFASIEQPIAAVIDHHETGGDKAGELSFRFRDIRPKVLATSSIVAGYLREQSVPPAPPLATALTYGVHSDALGYGNRFSRVDRAALTWLSRFLDPDLLNKIRNATLPKEYYEDLVLALESCFTYDEAAVCFLPRATGAEVIGEVADLLIRCDGLERVLCAAEIAGRMVVSVRTTTRGGNAAALIAAALSEVSGASWGGHEHRAGGQIEVSSAGSTKKDLEAEIRRSWLLTCEVAKDRGQRLVSRKDIIKALR
jgi:nanoRNase/pAp phosphatase (c-di-AMP/oligoRNAs hydrolase)